MGRVTAARQREVFAALAELADQLDGFGELDAAISPAETATALRDLARLRVAIIATVAALKAQPRRRCADCGQPLNGRADQEYCDPTCRQRARRARLAGT